MVQDNSSSGSPVICTSWKDDVGTMLWCGVAVSNACQCMRSGYLGRDIRIAARDYEELDCDGVTQHWQHSGKNVGDAAVDQAQ